MFRKITRATAIGLFAVLTGFATINLAAAEEAATEQAPLYERLGGWDGINEVVKGTIALHLKNPKISHYFEGVDLDGLANHVTAFFAMGTGGPEQYTGRDMTSTHAALHMSDEDFDSAVADVMTSVRSHGAGETEQGEVAAILESLRPAVMGASTK